LNKNTGKVVFLLFGISSLAIAAIQLSGQIINKPSYSCSSWKVVDGDTFYCGKTKVRILGIDSPELENQKKWYIRFLLNISNGKDVNLSCLRQYAYEAKQFLEDYMANCRNISIKPYHRDKYGRLLAEVYCNNVDVGALEIEKGFAVVYPFGIYPNKDKYFNITLYAMRSNSGLWKCVVR